MTNQQYIDKARKEYQKYGEIEIDEGAAVSRGSDPGAYVAAWVWVYNGTDEDDGEPVGSEDEPDQEETTEVKADA